MFGRIILLFSVDEAQNRKGMVAPFHAMFKAMTRSHRRYDGMIVVHCRKSLSAPHVLSTVLLHSVNNTGSFSGVKAQWRRSLPQSIDFWGCTIEITRVHPRESSCQLYLTYKAKTDTSSRNPRDRPWESLLSYHLQSSPDSHNPQSFRFTSNHSRFTPPACGKECTRM